MSTIPTLQALCLQRVIPKYKIGAKDFPVDENDPRDIPRLVESSCRHILQHMYSPKLADIVLLRDSFRQLSILSKSYIDQYLGVASRTILLPYATHEIRQLMVATKKRLSLSRFHNVSYLILKNIVLSIFAKEMQNPELKDQARYLFNKFEAITDPKKFREETINLFYTNRSFLSKVNPHWTSHKSGRIFFNRCLKVAIDCGDHEFIPLLIKAGASLTRDPRHLKIIQTALVRCLTIGDIATIVSLVQANPAIAHMIHIKDSLENVDLSIEPSVTKHFEFAKNEWFVAFLRQLQETTPKKAIIE